MNIQEKVQLKSHTTFKIGGPASFFVVVSTLSELEEAVSYAREQSIPIFILGGGSNVLVSDQGFSGLVIKINLLGLTFEDKGDTVYVTSGAGENWDKLVEETVKRFLYGIENLSAIPGTVGAAPIQNIGAYGTEVSDTIVCVEALDLRTLKVQKFSNPECNFSYRESFFKQSKGKQFVVMNVCFALKKNGSLNKTYKDVANYFKDHTSEPTLTEMRSAIISIRKGKFPDLSKIGTAGSFFKNPIIGHDEATALKEKYPELPIYKASNGHTKISIAWILDHILHLKGVVNGKVGAYDKQPLVLVNYGDATQMDVKKFAGDITKAVKEKVGIDLIPEVTFVPYVCKAKNKLQ